MQGLYHKALHSWVSKIDLGEVGLEYSLHARTQSLQRRIPLLSTLKLNQVVEAERDANGTLTKLLVRKPCPGRLSYDVCIVIRPQANGRWLVVTAWLNRTTDRHATLDTSKYNAA